MMKIKFRQGTTDVEAEGTVEELAGLLSKLGSEVGVTPWTPPVTTWGWTPRTWCLHDFPSPWHSTVPPHCSKCGAQATQIGPWPPYFGGDITYTVGDPIWDSPIPDVLKTT